MKMAFVNWNELDSPSEFVTFFTALGFVMAGIIGWVTGRYNRATISTLKDSNAALSAKVDALTEETKLCQTQHHESIEKIGRLTGQVEAYKELFSTIAGNTQLETALDGSNKITKTTTVEKK